MAAAGHEKAKSYHAAAKEMVYLAEQGLGEKSTLDTACQEMLSHAASTSPGHTYIPITYWRTKYSASELFLRSRKRIAARVHRHQEHDEDL